MNNIEVKYILIVNRNIFDSSRIQLDPHAGRMQDHNDMLST